MKRLIFLTLLCLAPLIGADTALAKCKGRDLRKALTPQARSQIAAEVARTPFANGTHWVAQKGDQTIHVIGTMHAGDTRMGRVSRAVAPYVRRADLVMLEVRRAEIEPQWDALLKDPKVLTLQRGPYVSQIMRQDLWDELAFKMRFRGLSPDQIDRIQPWFLSEFVGNGDCDPFGWNRSKGLDDRIERTARSARVPMMSLETVAEAVGAKSTQPVRDQVRLLEMDMVSAMSYADMATTMRNGYFDENLTEAMLIANRIMYSDLKVSRKEVHRLLAGQDRALLDLRNKRWMPRILARKEKTIVVAVGGAHLPGRNGVLNLLKAKGYKLTRIPLK